jgi:predicted dehydrogenase
MHTLLFLEPGHFHATLTLRVPHPRVSDEIVVYATTGPELRDFLALVERFNTRAERPTRWRPIVITDADPLARLIAERRGDAVVLAGQNVDKARTFRRLHAAGFHVLADKPWLVEAGDLEDVRLSLTGWPLVMEIMTGRHDVSARLFKRLVDASAVFGAFRDIEPAIELDGAHCLEKLVDGAPLRRPWWFFDVRVQGSGAVDIPTHLVDRTQWLLEKGGEAVPRLLSARAWPTRVPPAAFGRITGEAGFRSELAPFLDGEVLSYLCNSELVYRIGGVTTRATTRWDLAPPQGGGDTHSAVAHGTRADILLEQGPHTANRRRLFVESRGDVEGAGRTIADAVNAIADGFPGVGVTRVGAERHEVTIPPGLDAGHESHFTRVRDEFLRAIDDRRWPAALAARTLAKYTLLAEAAARTSAGDATPMEERR